MASYYERTRLRYTWRGMMRRCYNSKHVGWHRYGGRGIAVCPEWHNYECFEEWAHSNGYANDLTIERKNNDLGYEPNNCTWVRSSEQPKNRSIVRPVTIAGETKNLAEWARDSRCSVTHGTIHDRVAAGWSVEEAILSPQVVGNRGKTGKLKPSDVRRIRSLAEGGAKPIHIAEEFGVSRKCISNVLNKVTWRDVQ